jgi:hypothetical protein
MTTSPGGFAMFVQPSSHLNIHTLSSAIMPGLLSSCHIVVCIYTWSCRHSSPLLYCLFVFPCGHCASFFTVFLLSLSTLNASKQGIFDVYCLFGAFVKRQLVYCRQTQSSILYLPRIATAAGQYFNSKIADQIPLGAVCSACIITLSAFTSSNTHRLFIVFTRQCE